MTRLEGVSVTIRIETNKDSYEKTLVLDSETVSEFAESAKETLLEVVEAMTR